MAKLRVHNLAVSLDGYAAGPGQDAEHPRGMELAEFAASEGVAHTRFIRTH
jgi:hypothetical protein